ncbi:MAG: hypothetical protein AAF226_19240, partial [Verrucomicrobiota bacterium]
MSLKFSDNVRHTLRLIHSPAPIEEVMESVLKIACNITESSRGSFALVDWESETLDIKVTLGEG